MPVSAKSTFYEMVRTGRFSPDSAARLSTSEYAVSTYGKIRQLEKHTGCINTVNWNESGSKLITGSDDRTVIIWSGSSFEPLMTIPTGHRNNVFCATIVPGSNDEKLVSCAADGCVHLLDIESGERDVLYESEFTGYCFKHCMDPASPATTGIVTISDGSVVRFDLRTKTSMEITNVRQDINLRHLSLGRFSSPPSGTDLKFNPIDPYMFALGTSTKAVLLFDTRNMSTCGSKIVPEFTKRPPETFPGETEAVSGLDWDRRNGLIVNYCRQSVIELDAGLVAWNGNQPVTYKVGKSKEIPRQWTGRVNHQTFLKEVALLGKNGEYVATGGDCGNLYIWSRFSVKNKLIIKKSADPYVLNCLAPHPSLPLLATSGIASTADLWDIFASDPMEPFSSEDESEEESWGFTQREQLSVEEARDRLVAANVLRAQGNQAFRESNFLTALNLYRQACTSLEFQCGADESLTNQRRGCLEKCLTNKAAALMGLSRWTEAIDACDEALDINPSCHRALVRRSKCYLRLGSFEAALEDIEHVLLTNPTDAEALSLLDSLHDHMEFRRR